MKDKIAIGFGLVVCAIVFVATFDGNGASLTIARNEDKLKAVEEEKLRLVDDYLSLSEATDYDEAYVPSDDDYALPSDSQLKNDNATNALSLSGKLCAGWCNQQYLPLVECSHKGLMRLRTAFQIENCHAALQSAMNLRLVNQKLEKLADDTVFVFFRGAAALFDYNMMCADPGFAAKRLRMPRVYSNGDCHPENFGVMVQASGALVWGINDFDQSFLTPFGWDVKRGATGFALAIKVRAWAEEDISRAARLFVESYVDTIMGHGCQFKDDDRFIENSFYVNTQAPLIAGLFKKSRDRESNKNSIKWLTQKMGIDLSTLQFVESDQIQPLPKEMISEFQASIDAYLYHGVAALAKFPNDGNFYKVLSVARKVGSGTGSIGLNRFYILIKGRYAEENGYIVLEMKEEVNSVLEVFFHYTYTAQQEGKRAVDAVRSAWPYANLFYGWTTFRGNAYIVREKSRHHVSADLMELSKEEYMQYSSHAGRALAFYHIRARCPNYQCALGDNSAVDTEICSNIVRYIAEHGNFTNVVHSFALRETKRQVNAWNLLRQFVNPRRGKGTAIDLLRGGEKPASCA